MPSDLPFSSRTLAGLRPPPLDLPGAAPLRGWLARAWRTHRTRRALAALDPRALADIGLTEGAALREAMRAPWALGRR